MLSPRDYPITTRMLLWIIAPLIVFSLVAFLYLRQSLPPESGTFTVDGLDGPVEIFRDDHGVVRILGSTDADAFFALGYVHAQDRLWQMVYQRRLGQGRLSEIFGSRTLPSDQYMRTLGLYRAAESALASLDPAAKMSLSAYANGVNAWLSDATVLPPEFHVLDFEPEPWAPVDSLLQTKLLALTLAFNHRQELVNDVLVQHIGSERADEVLTAYPDDAPTVTSLTPSVDVEIASQLVARHEEMSREFGLGGRGLGSNAWVVAGQHTQSGAPLLANDPHLATRVPSDWYLAELVGDRLHVSGATIPGLPVVVLGHNQSVAWGATALGADVQDLYIERTHHRNEHQYEVEGAWTDLDVREEWILVKADFPSFLNDPIPPLKWEVRGTRHGPLISDVIDRLGQPIALRWTALAEVDRTYQSFLGLNYAEDWEEFGQALRHHLAPTLNFLYADRQGNIGSIAAGQVPVRASGSGRLPVPGWTSSHEWLGYVAPERLPQVLNPPSGFLVSANHKTHAPDYPYLISNNWEPPYRAQRIIDVLQGHIDSGQPIDVDDLITLQGDLVSNQALEMLPLLRSLPADNPSRSYAQELLRDWDGSVSADSTAALLYQAWLRQFNRSVLNDELRGDLRNPDRLDVLLNIAERLNPLFLRDAVADTAQSGLGRWCDHVLTEDRESCTDIALQALDKAVEETFTATGSERIWGDVHYLSYRHRGFSDAQLLDSIFNRDRVSGGDAFTVNVGTWGYTKGDGYRQASSASYRQVIDLADWSRSRFANSTGQSGNILSAHYDDHMPLHDAQRLLPMPFGAELDTGLKSVLRLEPAHGPATAGVLPNAAGH